MDPQTRRRWLATCVGTGVAGLAGCTSRGGDDSDSSDDRSDDGIQTDDSDDVPLDIGDETDEPAPDEWLMTGVDLENTGYHPTASGPTGDVSERWVYEAGDPITSEIAVSDGIAYANSMNRTSYAIDIENGNQIWKNNPTGTFQGSPTIIGKEMYVNNNGRISEFDIDTGEILWFTGSDVDPKEGVKYYDGVLYTSCGNGYVKGVNPENGNVVWEHELEGTGRNTIAISDGVIFTSSSPPHVYAVDIETGERLWEAETPGGGTSRGIAVDQNHLYAGIQEGDTLYAFDVEDGSESWSTDVGGYVYSSIAIANDRAFARVENSIIALDTVDGSIIWEEPSHGSRSNISLADGVIYATTNKGIAAFEMDSGETIWEFETEEQMYATPTIVNDCVIIGSQSGKIYCLY